MLPDEAPPGRRPLVAYRDDGGTRAHENGPEGDPPARFTLSLRATTLCGCGDAVRTYDHADRLAWRGAHRVDDDVEVALVVDGGAVRHQHVLRDRRDRAVGEVDPRHAPRCGALRAHRAEQFAGVEVAIRANIEGHDPVQGAGKLERREGPVVVPGEDDRGAFRPELGQGGDVDRAVGADVDAGRHRLAGAKLGVQLLPGQGCEVGHDPREGELACGDIDAVDGVSAGV